MRPVEFLAALSPLVTTTAVMLVATRRRVVRRFEQAAAVEPAAAIPQPASMFPAASWWTHRLERGGVLRRTTDGRMWLDCQVRSGYRRVRRRRGLAMV